MKIGLLGDVAEDILTSLVKWTSDGLSTSFVTLNTFWMQNNDPTQQGADTVVGPQLPSDNHSYTYGQTTGYDLSSGTDWLNNNHAPASAAAIPELNTVLGWLFWLGLSVAIASILVIGIRIALNHRNGEPLANLGRLGVILVATILMSSAVAIVSKIVPSVTQTPNNTIELLRIQTAPLTMAIAAAAVIAGAIHIFFTQKSDGFVELGKSLFRLIIVATLSLSLISLLSAAGDSFSNNIIQASIGCKNDSTCLAKEFNNLFSSDGVPAAILYLILGLLAIIATMVQMIMLVFRNLALIIIAGVLPLAAAATNTKLGKQIWEKALGWTIAFLAFKPAAAIVYATAFSLINDKTSSYTGMIQGMTLLILAPVMMPAMMKLFAPGGLGGGGAMGGAAIGVMAGAAASKMNNKGIAANMGGGAKMGAQIGAGAENSTEKSGVS